MVAAVAVVVVAVVLLLLAMSVAMEAEAVAQAAEAALASVEVGAVALHRVATEVTHLQVDTDLLAAATVVVALGEATATPPALPATRGGKRHPFSIRLSDTQDLIPSFPIPWAIVSHPWRLRFLYSALFLRGFLRSISGQRCGSPESHTPISI